jgi:hypothetical protein
MKFHIIKPEYKWSAYVAKSTLSTPEYKWPRINVNKKLLIKIHKKPS